MNSRQMVRMMRQHGISVVRDNASGLWYAGDCHYRTDSSTFEVEVEHANSLHVGKNPEVAVEDYCNARNLEWDY